MKSKTGGTISSLGPILVMGAIVGLVAAFTGSAVWELPLWMGTLLELPFVILGIVGVWLTNEAKKDRIAKKEAFEQEWRQIRGLAGNMKWRMDDSEWNSSRQRLRELLSPHLAEGDPDFEDLLRWLAFTGPWREGMGKSIFHEVSRLKDIEWSKRRL